MAALHGLDPMGRWDGFKTPMLKCAHFICGFIKNVINEQRVCYNAKWMADKI
jgi:hypothetical protein